MVFGGAKISAPAMAAAHGMKDITLHQATNKLVRPLMQHGPEPLQPASSLAAPLSAGQEAAGLPSAPGGSPLAALTELAPGMLPSAPDLVPFPEVPRGRPIGFVGQPQGLAPGTSQTPAGSLPRSDGIDPSAAFGSAPADPAAAMADPPPAPRTASAAAGRRRPAAAPPDNPLDEVTIRPGGPRLAGRKRSV